MKSKLTYIFAGEGYPEDAIFIEKKKGKLTMNEIFNFLHEPEQLRRFDGDLAMITFRVNSNRQSDIFDEDDDGDSQLVLMVGEDSPCECGKSHDINKCPKCGASLMVQ